MGLFGKSKKDERIDRLESENRNLRKSNQNKSIRISQLEELNHDKDLWMDSMASEALRKGSSLGGQVLADKKKYLKNKSK